MILISTSRFFAYLPPGIPFTYERRCLEFSSPQSTYDRFTQVQAQAHHLRLKDAGLDRCSLRPTPMHLLTNRTDQSA